MYRGCVCRAGPLLVPVLPISHRNTMELLNPTKPTQPLADQARPGPVSSTDTGAGKESSCPADWREILEKGAQRSRHNRLSGPSQDQPSAGSSRIWGTKSGLTEGSSCSTLSLPYLTTEQPPTTSPAAQAGLTPNQSIWALPLQTNDPPQSTTHLTPTTTHQKQQSTAHQQRPTRDNDPTTTHH